jgi:hypothetical protein
MTGWLMNDKFKDFEGIGHGLIEVLPQQLTRGTEENHEIRRSGFPVSQQSFEPSTSGAGVKSCTVTSACGFKNYAIMQIFRIVYCFTIYL